MKETWESCESLTTAVGNLKVLMMNKMEGLYDKFSMHLTVWFARWTRKSALRKLQMFYKMVMWAFTTFSEGCGGADILWRRELVTEGDAPYLICGFWSLGLGLECLLSSQTLILCLLWYYLCISFETFTSSCLFSSTGISNSATSAQGTAFLYSKVLLLLSFRQAFPWWQLWPEKQQQQQNRL